MDSLLSVENLTVCFDKQKEQTLILQDISFNIEKAKTFVLLGESGSGKSLTALSIMRLLPPDAQITSGKIRLTGLALHQCSEKKMRQIRGKRISMIFQEPQTALNPVLTVGQQIAEVVFKHQKLSSRACQEKVFKLLEAVHIPEPKRRFHDYAHQFSGGMKQRIMIAMALAGEPDLLIADEPTTALDVTIQAQILELLQILQKQTGLSILFITHDLGVAAQMGDQIAVMRAGELVEISSCKTFFKSPQHPYSKQLFNAIPSWEKRSLKAKWEATSPAILEVHDLKIHYPIRKGFFKRIVGHVRAVDGISLKVYPKQTVAIVGESGSGKTTLGKGILQLIPDIYGKVQFNGTELTTLSSHDLRRQRRDIQFVFQDPFASMNPRMLVGDIIAEGLVAQRIICDVEARGKRVNELLEQVGLKAAHRYRYPHEFSGGQRQRICIARALALNPKLIICDEPTSALDVSVQADILQLLRILQDKFGLSYLFITHNISVVEYIADEVIVMYQGKVIEQGNVEKVLFDPTHQYTKKLLASVPRVDFQK